MGVAESTTGAGLIAERKPLELYRQLVENVPDYAIFALDPRVMRETVGVSPLTVLLGILIGAALYGLPGAFLAVPIAGAVQVLLAHVLRSEDASQAEEHADAGERLEQQGAPPAVVAQEAAASATA
jgi:hypothetical protein